MRLARINNSSGFTLIELMIVVAIIGILAAIAIPNFLGMQEKAKRRSIEEAAASARGELHSWINAGSNGEAGVIDRDGSGVVTTTEPPMTTLPLVPANWISSFYEKKGKTQYSPWNGRKNLFTVGAPAGQSGVIVFSILNGGRGIKIVGYDINSSTVYVESISID